MNITSDKDVYFVGDIVIITATLPENATGVVTFHLDNNLGWATEYIEDGIASHQYNNLKAGNHTITLKYREDGKNITDTGSITFEVLKNDPQMEVSFDKYTYIVGDTMYVTAKFADDVTGTVRFHLSYLNGYDFVTIENGTATISYPAFYTGQYSFTTNYLGDNKYNACEQKDFVSIKLDPQMEVSFDKDVYFVGDNVTITVKFLDDVTGLTGFSLDDQIFMKITEIVNGTATMTYTDLEAGNHTFNIHYGANEKYAPSTQIVSTVINKLNPEMEVSFDKDVYFVGDDVVITVNFLDDVTGMVGFHLDDLLGINYIDIVNGTATTIYPRLAAGNHTFDITYIGDNKYSGAGETVSCEINKLDSKMTITLDDYVYTVGDTIKVTARFAEDVTGIVRFHLDYVDGYDDVAIENGTATVTYPAIFVGNHNISVKYLGDEKYLPADSTAIAKIKLNPQMEVSFDKDVYFVGDDVVITVKFAGDESGKVGFHLDDNDGIINVKIVNGTATHTYHNLKAGNHNFDVSYLGDDKYIPLTSHLSCVINKLDPEMEVSFDKDVYFVGDDVVITVKFAGDESGKVTFHLDDLIGLITVDVVNGTATYTYHNLEAGNHTFDVGYNGDDKYLPLTSHLSCVINKLVPQMDVLFDKDYYIVDDDVVITVKFAGDESGQVGFHLDNLLGISYTDIVNGTATYTYSNLKAGNHTVDISYNGDEKYFSTVEKVPFEINHGNKLIAEDLSKFYKGEEAFEVLLTYDNMPVVNETVAITINGKTYYKVTNDEGIAKLNINLAPGVYAVTSTYGGLSVENTVSVYSCIYSADVVKMYKNDTQYHVLVLNNDGTPIVGESVAITINGKTYYKVTNEYGIATLNINLAPGTYDIYATHPKNGEVVSTKVTVLNNLISQDLVKYYQTETPYQVRLIDSDYKGISGESVAITINGKTYYKVTDENGFATLNINLLPGEYQITANHAGLIVSNKVIVLNLQQVKPTGVKFDLD